MYGVVDINGERIEYLTIDVIENTIGRLRRGTMGTSIKEHEVNTSVIDIVKDRKSPNSDAKTWYKLTDSHP